MTDQQHNDRRVRLSGMWRHTDKNGQPYYSGSLGGGKLLMFPVKEKKGYNSPDANLFLVPLEENKSEQADNSAAYF